MKSTYAIVCVLALVILTSCNEYQPPSRNPNTLLLTVEIKQREVRSLDDLHIQIYLSNRSESSVLVHKRLYWLSFPAPSSMTEVAISISDASGKLVDEMGFFVNRQYPGENTLDVLEPGEQIKKTIYLKNGFHENTFKKGEKYTIVVIYQNDLDITKTIDGVDVPSWVGSVRSNAETFIILP